MKESNTVKEFLHSKFGAVRTVIVNEEIWMVADDVCKILEIKNTSQAVNGNPSRGDKGVGEKNRGIYNVYTLGGNQDVLCISEQNHLQRNSKIGFVVKLFQLYAKMECI